jgi:hypothetical protein
MWNSRDLALVIILAVASFVYTVFVGQLGNMVTGILGFNYFFVIGHAVIISLSFLMYQGRRWRFFLQSVLVAFLTLPTFMTGQPFDLLSKWPSIAGGFLVDLIFNSVYSYFVNRKQLFLWAFLSVFVFFLIAPLFAAINMLLFYPPQVFTTYVSVYLLLFPVTLVELLIGSFLGKQTYTRINKPIM